LIQKQFIQAIQSFPDYENKRFLLAVSGGVDSMVLAHLFQTAGLQAEWAHCNFKLRGNESDDDQAFVENEALKSEVKLHLNICDLRQSGEKNIQIAARNERYRWFDILMQKHNFDYLVTAHHLNDSIETFFINIQRPTGLKGLLGIKDTGKIIRPLQYITRDEIKQYALSNQIKWREDSSNKSDKYLRNFIRLNIIPKFVERNPEFYQNFKKTFSYLQQSQAVIDEWMNQQIKRFVFSKDNLQTLDLQNFTICKHPGQFLFHWLSPYGFSDWKSVENLLDAQSGKEIFSKNYRLTKHSGRLILEEINQENNQVFYMIHKGENEIFKPFHLRINTILKSACNEQKYLKASKNEAYVDESKVTFPLIIRKWQAGDYFYPLGMQGKKKLSDYFKDEKMTPSEKEKIWLICDARKNIIWIPEKRLDNRFKITPETKNVLNIKLLEI
jgi:tRNA(Ile)-lysidine synthase